MLLHFRKQFVVYLFPVVFSASTAQAANFTLQGQFTEDDQVQVFDIVVSAPSLVDIRTFGYAGGTTATGAAVPAGGFDPILTLFDSTGLFVTDNDEGSGVPADPVTGMMADARITLNLAAGSYIVALTQYDNFSIGDIADGFVQEGNPNFTNDPTFTTGLPCPSNLFRDISGTPGRCRDGDWTVDFLDVASVTPRDPSSVVPEPATVVFLGVGLGLALALRGRFRAESSSGRHFTEEFRKERS